jgi:hypothetical protein
VNQHKILTSKDTSIIELYNGTSKKKLWAKIFADEFKIIKIINYKVKRRKICDFLTYNFLLPV